MSKIIGIIGIATVLGHTYRVGAGPAHIEDAPAVEKIVFESVAYNNGHQTRKPGYVVFFENSPVRHIVSEDHTVEVLVDLSKVEKSDKEVIPDLPVSDQKAENAE